MAVADGKDHGEVEAERREYPGASDDFPRSSAPASYGRRVMGPEEILERDWRNLATTSEALRRRALEGEQGVRRVG